MKKIPLTQGKFALVDDADFEWLNQWKWCAQKTHNIFYAMRKSRSGSKRLYIGMHSLITVTPKGMETDHRDGNGLNNQRINLRVCTPLENRRNTRLYKSNKTGYKGVDWHQSYLKWRARIVVNKKNRTLGHFNSPIEAAKAYDEAAKKYFGEFARLNFPEGGKAPLAG